MNGKLTKSTLPLSPRYDSDAADVAVSRFPFARGVNRSPTIKPWDRPTILNFMVDLSLGDNLTPGYVPEPAGDFLRPPLPRPQSARRKRLFEKPEERYSSPSAEVGMSPSSSAAYSARSTSSFLEAESSLRRSSTRSSPELQRAQSPAVSCVGREMKNQDDPYPRAKGVRRGIGYTPSARASPTHGRGKRLPRLEPGRQPRVLNLSSLLSRNKVAPAPSSSPYIAS